MKHFKYFVLLVAALMMGFVSCTKDDNNSGGGDDDGQFNGTALTFNNASPLTIATDVQNLGTFTKDDVDEDAALGLISKLVDFWDLNGGCSAASKRLSNGDLIFGRNMDLPMSTTPVHVFMTEFGKYKTVNLQYFPGFDSKALGMDIDAVYPFISTDVMNEKGLYMQTNMRDGENFRFSCAGTNPGKKRIFVACLGQYVCSRCATVDEAIAMIKDLDVYTGCNPLEELKSFNWPFVWNMGDANGNRAIVEFAQNEVSVVRDNDVHTNFFITDKWKKIETHKCGVGRYDFLKQGLGGVNTETDMHKLLETVYYWKMYEDSAVDPRKIPFDVRTEWVGFFKVNDKGELDDVNGNDDNCTSDWILDPKNEDDVYKLIQQRSQTLVTTDVDSLRKHGYCWKSVLHVVTNCTQKKMTVSFYEKSDPKNTFTYKFQ